MSKQKITTSKPSLNLLSKNPGKPSCTIKGNNPPKQKNNFYSKIAMFNLDCYFCFMKTLLKKSPKIRTNVPQKTEVFINNFYMQKYGSYEKPRKKILKLKEQSKDKALFQKLMSEKFNKNLHIDFI